MPVDFEALRVAIRDGAARAFAAVREETKGEKLYAFALYTDDGAMTIVPTANTEESVEDEEAKWATGEWAYEGVGDTELDEANRLLNVDDRYEGSFAVFKQQFYETITAALEELERAGAFGTGTDREELTVFVSISDSDDAVELETASARRCNSPRVAARFAKRYDA